jgi:hypothetical protein
MEQRILGLAAAVLLVPVWNSPAKTARQAGEYSAQMTGSLETPPNTAAGQGTVTLTISGGKLHYMITVGGLSGPATMAHIHVGKPGVAGPPVLTFVIKNIAAGILADDSVDLTKEVSKGVSGDSLKTLLDNGNAYANVHTAAHPAGEIRGQVLSKKM